MHAGFLGVIGVVVVVGATFVACRLFGFAGLAVTPAVLVVLMLIGSPMKLLGLLWGMTLLAPSLEVILPAILVKGSEQVLGLFILVLVLGQIVITRSIPAGLRVMTFTAVGLLCLVVTTGLINDIAILSTGFAFLSYFKHYWILFFVVSHVRFRHARSVYFGTLAAFGVQILANIAIMLGLNPVPHLLGRGVEDAHVGTLADAHGVAYYMVGALILLIARLRAKSTPLRKGLLVAAILLALVQFFITFAMHAYVLLVVGLVAQQLLFGRKWFKGATALGALALIMVVVFGSLLSLGPFEEFKETYATPQDVRYRWELMKRGPKFRAYEEVFVHGDRHMRYPLLGAGLGNYTSVIAFMGNRPLARQPHMSYFYTTRREDVHLGGSILASPRTGYISLYGELGPLGLVLFWGAYVYAGYRIWRQTRDGMYTDKYRRALAEAFVVGVILFLVVNMIRDMEVTLFLSLGLWIWAGLLWNPLSEEDEAGESASPSGVAPSRPMFASEHA